MGERFTFNNYQVLILIFFNYMPMGDHIFNPPSPHNSHITYLSNKACTFHVGYVLTLTMCVYETRTFLLVHAPTKKYVCVYSNGVPPSGYFNS